MGADGNFQITRWRPEGTVRDSGHVGWQSPRGRGTWASRVGFEPTTKGLKVPCSAAELPARRQRTRCRHRRLSGSRPGRVSPAAPASAAARRGRRPAGSRRPSRPSCARVARDAEAMCGTIRQLRSPTSGSSIGIGSGSVTSSAAAAIEPSRSASASAGLVDDRAAGRVDEHGRRLHPAQASSALIRWRVSSAQVHVERHEVALRRAAPRAGRYVAPSGAVDLGRQRLHVVVQDRHPEPARPPRHRLADPPEADDAERRAVDVRPEQQQRAPRLPAAVADVAVALGDAPRGGHQQRQGEVGGRLGQDARRVADRRRRAAAQAGDIDVVEADGVVADDLELRPGRVEELVVDPVGEQRQRRRRSPRPRRSSSSRGGGSSSGQMSASQVVADRRRGPRRGCAAPRRPAVGRSSAHRRASAARRQRPDPAAALRGGSRCEFA